MVEKLPVKEEQIEKRTKALLKSNIDPLTIHENLRDVVFVDHFKYKYPKVKKNVIVVNFKVASMVRKFVPNDPLLVEIFRQQYGIDGSEGIHEVQQLSRNELLNFMYAFRPVDSILLPENFNEYRARIIGYKFPSHRCYFSYVMNYHFSPKDLSSRIAFELEKFDPRLDMTLMLNSRNSVPTTFPLTFRKPIVTPTPFKDSINKIATRANSYPIVLDTIMDKLKVHYQSLVEKSESDGSESFKRQNDGTPKKKLTKVHEILANSDFSLYGNQDDEAITLIENALKSIG
jgi:hypothetical protein